MPNITTTDWLDSLTISDGGIYPLHRQQVSRTAGGTAQVRDLGESLWKAEIFTTAITLQDALDLETDILALAGSLFWVLLYDPRRDQPKNYASGSLAGYSYTSISATNRHIVNLTNGATILSKGDYFHFDSGGARYLHRVTKMVTDTQAQVWPAMSLNAPATADIVVDKPAARFQIEPETVSQKMVTLDQDTKIAKFFFKGVQTLK